MISDLSVSEIHDAIRKGGEIATLAPVMRRVVSSVSEGGEPLDHLLEVIRHDTALTIRVLRAANEDQEEESYAGNLKDAAENIGYRALKSMVLSSSFIDSEISESSFRLYSALQRMWERSLYDAIGARMFAEEIGTADPERAFLNGILLNIGSQFLLCQFPNLYIDVLERWEMEGGDLTQHEMDALGVDHTIIGEELARGWNLGEHITSAIRSHHQETLSTGDESMSDGNNGQTPSVSDELSALHDMLKLSSLAAGVFFESRNSQGIERVNKFAQERFNIDEAKVSLILQRIAIEADRIAESLISGSSDGTNLELLRSINQELGRVTLSYDQLIRELKSAMRKAETLARKLEEANHKLREAVNIDPLTRVYNRRYFEEFMIWNFDRALRYGTPLGCLMIDIDHFKLVNDQYGHLTGDRVLYGVAEALRTNLRRSDVIARYGGEEFVIMLPETKTRSVQSAAQKLLKAVSKLEYPAGEDELLRVTVSIGYVAYNSKDFPQLKTHDDLIKLADENMYHAKQNGRNRVWPDTTNEKSTNSNSHE